MEVQVKDVLEKYKQLLSDAVYEKTLNEVYIQQLMDENKILKMKLQKLEQKQGSAE
jgi:hypothetical protein